MSLQNGEIVTCGMIFRFFASRINKNCHEKDIDRPIHIRIYRVYSYC